MNVKKLVTPYLEYCEYRKELNAKTLKAYRIDLRQFYEFVNCDEPSKQNIEDYITDLHKNYKQRTIKRKLASIKAFYNYLEEEEIIEDSPFRRIKIKFKEQIVLPRIIPRNEIELLLNTMYGQLARLRGAQYRVCLRDVAVVEVFFATGARVYELSNIKYDCVDLETGLIRIMGKGGKERFIQVCDPDVLNLLRKYYKLYEEEIRSSGYFFVNRKGQRYSEQSIRLMMKKYTRMAQIERNITPHMFRHSFATYLIEEGVDISCVQQILGHCSIKTTQIYIHIASKKQAEILRSKHPRNRMDIRSVA